jgi:hypothetical protein
VTRGRLAQLVERLLYTQDVGGSSPSPPTSLRVCGASDGTPHPRRLAGRRRKPPLRQTRQTMEKLQPTEDARILRRLSSVICRQTKVAAR